jgi:hypothetical protein
MLTPGIEIVERRPHSKHKKRYWFVCQDCGARRRAAHPGAKYCDEACQKHAQRQRQKQRQEQARLEAERQRQEQARLDAARKAEAARKAAEAQRRIDQAAEERRREEQAEAALKAREASRVFQRCECGNRTWHMRYERQGLLGPKKTIKSCTKCYKTEELPGVPVCPKCKESTLFMVNEFGLMRCEMCRHVFVGLKPGRSDG